MGVVAGVTRVDAAKLRELCEEPRELRWYLLGSDPEPPRIGWLGRLLGKQPEAPPPRREPWKEPPKEDSQYLDKAWHAIHVLLTGSPEPGDGPRAFLLSGRTVECRDFGVLVHDEDATRRIAEALLDVDFNWLTMRWGRVEATRQHVYLIKDCDENDSEVRDYVIEYGLELVQFVREAARRGCGLVVDING